MTGAIDQNSTFAIASTQGGDALGSLCTVAGASAADLLARLPAQLQVSSSEDHRRALITERYSPFFVDLGELPASLGRALYLWSFRLLGSQAPTTLARAPKHPSWPSFLPWIMQAALLCSCTLRCVLLFCWYSPSRPCRSTCGIVDAKHKLCRAKPPRHDEGTTPWPLRVESPTLERQMAYVFNAGTPLTAPPLQAQTSWRSPSRVQQNASMPPLPSPLSLTVSTH